MLRYRGIVGQRLVRLGAWAWVLGAVQFFVCHLVVESAWPVPYSWATNNISDLGNVGCGAWDGRYVCSPLHALMNASIVLEGVLLVAGLALTGSLWGGLSAWAWRVLILLTGVAWVVAGLAPADVNLDPHVLSAFVIFFLGNAGLVLVGNPKPGSGMGKSHPYSLVLGAVRLSSAVLFLSRQDLGLGLGTMTWKGVRGGRNCIRRAPR